MLAWQWSCGQKPITVQSNDCAINEYATKSNDHAQRWLGQHAKFAYCKLPNDATTTAKMCTYA
eukprot:scaffold223630_cov27-Tisochrysis_lutea.AAC.1